ncbi:MAG: hypothetical protein P8P90_02920 [Opitutales bacterium]|nr:hypothetical protein [Opitutales bacterium]
MISKKEDLSPPDKENLDRFVKISEAARIMGFANYNSVNHMNARGQLKLYKMPHKNVKRVLLSDINKILLRQRFIDEPDALSPPSKNKRGRPKKFTGNCN